MINWNYELWNLRIIISFFEKTRERTNIGNMWIMLSENLLLNQTAVIVDMVSVLIQILRINIIILPKPCNFSYKCNDHSKCEDNYQE